MSEAATLPPILLVGCGKMGGAMLSGWLEQGLSRAVVVEPQAGAAAALAEQAAGRVRVVPDAASVPAGFAPAAIVLAIKPQEAARALPPLAALASGAVTISIMAGRSVHGMQALLGESRAVVRAMPNTPAAVRQGFTVAFAGPNVAAEQRALADALLGAVGEVAWVEQEALLDPVTAVSGGGPAYVFLLAELLQRAAESQGVPAELARRMARVTVSGSGALLAGSRADAADLRRAVTSPKGTTERALAVLMREEAWPALMEEAIAAATHSASSRERAGTLVRCRIGTMFGPMSDLALPGSGPTDDSLVTAFWQVVAERGWQGVTARRVAQAADTDLATLRARLPTTWHMLRRHVSLVDQLVLRDTVPNQGGSPRDRIFDALMRRVDALQPHRDGILRFLEDVRRDPLTGLAMSPLLLASMGWMLEAAELDPRGLSGAARAHGLLGVWFATLRAWKDDPSEDLGPTMAALDRALDRAEQVARTVRLNPGDLADPPGGSLDGSFGSPPGSSMADPSAGPAFNGPPSAGLDPDGPAPDGPAPGGPTTDVPPLAP